MRGSLVILVLIILSSMLSTGLSKATAETQNQEPPLLQWYVNWAQNDLQNSKYALQAYDNVLNDTTKLKIYADMVTSFDQINQGLAGYSDPSRLNLSLQSGRIAMFLATRSYYRIAIAVAFAHILSAELEINMTPQYVPPSPEANASLTQAELAYYSYYYYGYLEYEFPVGISWLFDAQYVNGTAARMRAAVEALLYGPNNNTPSVVATVDTALKQAELWNSTQEPLAHTQLLDKINSVRESFLYTVLPLMLLLLGVLLFVFTTFVRSSARWAKRTIRLPPAWRGRLDQRYTAILLLEGGTLFVGGPLLAYSATQFSGIVTIASVTTLWWASIAACGLGALSIVLVFWNMYSPSRASAISAIVLVIATIVVYLTITALLYQVYFSSAMLQR